MFFKKVNKCLEIPDKNKNNADNMTKVIKYVNFFPLPLQNFKIRIMKAQLKKAFDKLDKWIGEHPESFAVIFIIAAVIYFNLIDKL